MSVWPGLAIRRIPMIVDALSRRRHWPAFWLCLACNFVNLQVGLHAGEIGLADLSSRLPDYAETAALIAALDLLITVDTSVAHVAGALGKPAWLMLPHAPDWRWLLGRDDTPWYASLRLFRQPQPGDWDSVIAAVADALGSCAAARRRPLIDLQS